MILPPFLFEKKTMRFPLSFLETPILGKIFTISRINLILEPNLFLLRINYIIHIYDIHVRFVEFFDEFPPRSTCSTSFLSSCVPFCAIPSDSDVVLKFQAHNFSVMHPMFKTNINGNKMTEILGEKYEIILRVRILNSGRIMSMNGTDERCIMRVAAPKSSCVL